MIRFKTLTLNRIAAYYLTLEIVVAHGIVGVHYRSRRVGLNGILENAPVSLVTIDNTRGNIGRQRQQTVFRGVHQGCTCTILLASAA